MEEPYLESTHAEAAIPKPKRGKNLRAKKRKTEYKSWVHKSHKHTKQYNAALTYLGKYNLT